MGDSDLKSESQRNRTRKRDMESAWRIWLLNFAEMWHKQNMWRTERLQMLWLVIGVKIGVWRFSVRDGKNLRRRRDQKSHPGQEIAGRGSLPGRFRPSIEYCPWQKIRKFLNWKKYTGKLAGIWAELVQSRSRGFWGLFEPSGEERGKLTGLTHSAESPRILEILFKLWITSIPKKILIGLLRMCAMSANFVGNTKNHTNPPPPPNTGAPGRL